MCFTYILVYKTIGIWKTGATWLTVVVQLLGPVNYQVDISEGSIINCLHIPYSE